MKSLTLSCSTVCSYDAINMFFHVHMFTLQVEGAGLTGWSY